MAYGAGRWPAGTYWFVVVITLSVVLGVLTVSILPWTHRPAGAVADFVPSDGTRIPAAIPTEPTPENGEEPEQAWWENSVVPAKVGGKAMPAAAAELLRRGATLPDRVLWNWSWWRSTLHTTPGSDGDDQTGNPDAAPWQSRLLRVDNATVTWVLAYDTSGGEAYEPAITVVPDNPTEATDWEQGGIVTRSGEHARRNYTARVSWTAADDPGLVGRGCWAAAVELTVAEEVRDARRLIFCPEQGIVADLGIDEQVIGTPVERRPLPQTEAPAVPPWQPDGWEFHRGPPLSLDWPAEDGGQVDERATGGMVRPVQTAGEVIVRSNGDFALFGLHGPPGQRRLQWVVTPGDRILSLRAIGRTVIATTGDRRLVAYDEQGQWLWEVHRKDVVQNAAARVTEDSFVVAGLDGTVELRDLATGAEVWHADIGAAVNAISADPVAHTVHVIDDTGTLTEFGADGPTPQWQREVAEGRAQLVSSGGGVTVLLPGAVRRLAAGEEVWGRSLAFANRIDADEHRAYVVADQALRVFDLTTGKVLWRRAGVHTTAVPPSARSGPGAAAGDEPGDDAVAVVAADRYSVAALTADGRVLTETDLEVHDQTRLLPLADGVLVHWAPEADEVTWEHDG